MTRLIPSRAVEGAPGRRVTLEDVARVAGVSVATVSRALASDRRISVRTREIVGRAAEQLRYVPNAAARSLVTRATRTLGLLIPDMTDPLNGQVATAFEQEAAARGYGVIVANGFADPDRERQMLRAITTQRAAGIAVMGGVLEQAEVLAAVAPELAVFIGTENLGLAGPTADLPVGSLRADEASGIEALVALLVESGRRHIGFVSGPPVLSNTTRRNAALAALADRGLDGRRRLYYGGPEGWLNGPAVAGRIAQDRPDAVLCYDDKLALAVMDGFRDVGVRVPDDIAVAGFDDIPFAALANPRLTTVAQPASAMGRRAVQMLLAGAEGLDLPPSEVHPVRLMVRESTGRGPLEGHGARIP